MEKYDQLNEYELDSEEEGEDEDEKVEGSPKRRKHREFREKLKKHKDLIEKKIVNYYGKNFFGYPSSYSAYRMVKDTSRLNNDYLWYAIIGMTSMYLEQKISKDMLNTLTQVYRSDAGTCNVQGERQKGGIALKMGYQLPLLDHWSLFESMMNSSYMMTHMHLWEEKGVDRLKEYIHRLGISLQDAKQLYKYMPKDSQGKF
jgi:cell division control protein 45